jgi:hypothetical protein
MNCEFAKSNAVLYCYDELPDDVRHELEQHLERCADCKMEVKRVRALQEMMSLEPAQEPSPNLLAASRMRLQEALENAPQSSAWSRFFIFDFSRMVQSVKLAPAMAAAIFIIGFGLGIGATYRLTNHGTQGPQGPSGPGKGPVEASIGGIHSIESQPGSNQVSIKYDQVIPSTMQGPLDNPEIQKLLLMAAINNRNDGMRMDATGLLAQNSKDDNVRQELMFALRSDPNPGVRLQAIGALQPYVKGDIRVRDSVLEALMNDTSPGVRTEAIHALEPVKADSSVRHVLQTLARNDKNQFIRQRAQEMLNTTGEID